MPYPWKDQGHVGWGSEPPDLVEGISILCTGLDQMTSNGQFQPKLFQNYMILYVQASRAEEGEDSLIQLLQ